MVTFLAYRIYLRTQEVSRKLQELQSSIYSLLSKIEDSNHSIIAKIQNSDTAQFQREIENLSELQRDLKNVDENISASRSIILGGIETLVLTVSQLTKSQSPSLPNTTSEVYWQYLPFQRGDLVTITNNHDGLEGTKGYLADIDDDKWAYISTPTKVIKRSILNIERS